MQISLTLSTARYLTPSISFSTNVTSVEAKCTVPIIRDKVKAWKRKKDIKKQAARCVIYANAEINGRPPPPEPVPIAAAAEAIVLKLIAPKIHRKKEQRKRDNTAKLIQLLSIYPIASTIASYLNKAELKALFSPECNRFIYYAFRHHAGPLWSEQPHPNPNLLSSGTGSLRPSLMSAVNSNPQNYFAALTKQTRECERCGDTAHRFIPMLLDLGLTYELYTVLQGITKCYICKRSFCHACLVRFYVEGDTYRRNTARKARHACDKCLPKAQSLFGSRIGRLYRGPSQSDLDEWMLKKQGKTKEIGREIAGQNAGTDTGSINNIT